MDRILGSYTITRRMLWVSFLSQAYRIMGGWNSQCIQNMFRTDNSRPNLTFSLHVLWTWSSLHLVPFFELWMLKLWMICRIDSALDWETSIINEGRSPNLAPSKPASCCPFLTESNVTNCVVGAPNTFDKGCADYVSHVVPPVRGWIWTANLTNLFRQRMQVCLGSI